MSVLGLSTITTAWLALLLAGLFEIGWPAGLKLSQQPGYFVPGLIISAVCLIISGTLLWFAQKSIPIGTAYAVWTGLGAAGTFVLGVMVFGDSLTFLRSLGVIMIVGGVVVLKLGSAGS